MFFRKKKEREEVNKEVLFSPKEVFILETQTVSSCNDGTGNGPRNITIYFLATKKGNDFFELFSKIKIEDGRKVVGKNWENGLTPGSESEHIEFEVKQFDTPYIIHVEETTEYVKNEEEPLASSIWFSFILQKNIEESIRKEEI